MYSEGEIQQWCGEQGLNRARNKNRGGVNNEKGNTYENLFTVYKIASYTKQVIEQEVNIQLYAQIPAFVDDLIIDCIEISLLDCFQLKNSRKISWKNDNIAYDFRQQYRLNQFAKQRNSQLYLVVSDPQIKANRQADRPKDITPYSHVIYFPETFSLTQLLKQKPDFQDAIRDLCALDNPEPDKLKAVATALLGAWTSTDKSNTSVMAILTEASKCNPSYIRSFQPPEDLDPEVEEILDAIELFDYNLEKGFFHWKYAEGLDQGTFPHSTDTEQFRRFQDWIKRNQPTSFDDIEGLLIGSIN